MTERRIHLAWSVVAALAVVPMGLLAALAGQAIGGDWFVGRGPAAVAAWGALPALYVGLSLLLVKFTSGARRFCAGAGVFACAAAFCFGASLGSSHYPFG